MEVKFDSHTKNTFLSLIRYESINAEDLTGIGGKAKFPISVLDSVLDWPLI